MEGQLKWLRQVCNDRFLFKQIKIKVLETNLSKLIRKNIESKNCKEKIGNLNLEW